jgi:hypothetical protein
MLHSAFAQVAADVLRDFSGVIFIGWAVRTGLLDHSKWKQHDPPKCQEPLALCCNVPEDLNPCQYRCENLRLSSVGNKSHLFNLTQPKFILIKLVTLTCMLHVMSCT